MPRCRRANNSCGSWDLPTTARRFRICAHSRTGGPGAGAGEARRAAAGVDTAARARRPRYGGSDTAARQCYAVRPFHLTASSGPLFTREATMTDKEKNVSQPHDWKLIVEKDVKIPMRDGA